MYKIWREGSDLNNFVLSFVLLDIFLSFFQVWVLRIDVHILDTNGCLAEAAALSALGGLITFRRPQASVDPNTNELTVKSMEEAVPIRLHMYYLPILTSFILTPGNKILAEPDHQEEEVS